MHDTVTPESAVAYLREKLDDSGRRWSGPDEEGRYTVATPAGERRVWPDAVVAEAVRDGDLAAIDALVQTAASAWVLPPSWEVARLNVRPYPVGIDTDIADSLTKAVSRGSKLAAVWMDDEERGLDFLTRRQADAWGVDEGTLWTAALDNASRAALTTPLRVEAVGAERVVLFDTASIGKAGLLFAPEIRRRVEPHVGWPAQAVMPARDFVIVFPNNSSGTLGKLGGVVSREYAQSGYPVSKEVFELSDRGVTAKGTF